MPGGRSELFPDEVYLCLELKGIRNIVHEHTRLRFEVQFCETKGSEQT